MHRSLKPHAQAKKVPPPAIPGDPTPQQYQQQIPLYRLGASITNPAGKQLEDGIIMSSLISSPSLEEGGFNLPRETSVALRMKDEINDYAAAMSTSGSSQLSATAAKQASSQGGIASANSSHLLSGCTSNIVPCPAPVFCATLREPLTHKAAVYYHQQLALQEDQGIDLTQSPGRDSPGSSSGSAGSGSRHSTASLDSGRASSYLTGVSGTSIRGGGGPLSSPRCSSVSSCSIGSVDRQRSDELIIDWLMEMKYEEYAQLFIAAGYDLPTIARMTPEDLTAIGIKNPHHRERIKQRIDKLQVLDNLPHFVPGSIEEWLQLLRLEEYIQPLLDQSYKTVREVTQVTWEDLEDIGIVKLGHQKKILLAIKRVKDIISGKWNPGGSNSYQQHVRQPRGKSLESLEDLHDNSTRSHLTFSHYTATDYGHFGHPSQMHPHQQAMQQQQQQVPPLCGNRMLNTAAAMSWRRSYDDGDITPTNDATRDLVYEEGGGTLPRQQRGILQRAVLNSMPPLEHHHYMNAAAAEYVCHAAGIGGPVSLGGGNMNVAGGIIDNSNINKPYITGSPLTSKKIAPEPPRRHCSIRNSRTLSSDVTQLPQQAQQSLHAVAQNMYYGANDGTAMTSHHHASPAYMQQQLQTTQPIYANYATIQQTTAEIHCEKFHDNKSNSSIDSIDTIPFANENTGTIKQRLLNRQDMTQPQQQQNRLHSSSSSSSSSSTNTIANIAHSFHSLKSSSSLHDASLIRSDSIGSNASGGSTGTNTGMALLRSPTLQYPPEANATACGSSTLPTTITTTVDLHTSNSSGAVMTPDAIQSGTGSTSEMPTVSNIPGQKVSANVLNDIGNMLANLTDELDAMLEEEKRVGLNIDSE
ncbi:uncharacterized protein LOC119682421 isoform X2 [Teleopsis dalmanni]|uniref:uncharacterized protein LOC119682421 isoform X2 n=1 Tax=Teleopsis dalmanni TaxID=139649 RepID=UPI0018CCB155|nr:uncharacterized protein LOC119682421 isoform X2 [Teleopsis dalmanni]